MNKQPKNQKQIAREILDNRDFVPMNINVAPKHRERLQDVAEAMDLTLQEAATFLLYSMINDMHLEAKQHQLKMLNNN